MKQPKRILALLGAVLLAGMYVCTLVFALMKSELAQTLFRASLGCTILVPVLLYAFLLAARMLRPAKSPLVDNVIFDLGNVLIDFGWEELARKKAGEILRKVRNSTKAPGAEHIFTAGEKEWNIWQERKDKGVPITEPVQKEISAVRDELGLKQYIFPWEK